MEGSICLLLMIVSGLLHGTNASLGFTCITKLRLAQGEDGTIKCYVVGEGRSTPTSQFNCTRQIHAEQDTQVPITSKAMYDSQIDALSGNFSIYEYVGLFTCMYGSQAIQVVRMQTNADFLPSPVRVSRTVNVGDAVSLAVTRQNERSKTRWRTPKNPRVDKDTNGHLAFNISRVTIYDAGIYEVHQALLRRENTQAFIRLIVRECQDNRWGPPSCEQDCKVCLNGGVCDYRTGDCICTPGYGGDFCQTLYGYNHFGQFGSLRCDLTGLGDNSCAGMLFCLRDPYGCSCAAGYQGIDCTEERCLPYNGSISCGTTCKEHLDLESKPFGLSHSLTNSEVVIRWSPVNCPDGGDIVNYVYKLFLGGSEGVHRAGQVAEMEMPFPNLPPCNVYTFQVAALTTKGIAQYSSPHDFMFQATVPAGIRDLEVVPTDRTFNLTWSSPATSDDHPCPATAYEVIYDLIYHDQCNQTHRVGRTEAFTAETKVLRGLEPYSTYNISVVPINSAGNGKVVSVEKRTLGASPRATPRISDTASTTDNITVAWTSIPCGQRAGEITHYKALLYEPGTATPTQEQEDVNSLSAAFTNLNPCTSYFIIVHVFNAYGSTSSNKTVTTLIQAPDSVRNLTLNPTAAGRLHVSWTAPGQNASNPCNATRYYVEHTRVRTGQCPVVINQHTMAPFTDQTTTLLSGLEAYTTYNVAVTPRNKAGNSTATVKTATTLQTEPVTLQFNSSSSTSNSITVNWNSIPCENRWPGIIEYQSSITGIPSGPIETTQKESVSFSRLYPCSSYTVVTMAVHGGRESEVLTTKVTTRTAVPAPVRNLTLEPTEPGKLMVSWAEPGSPKKPCRPRSYLVEYRLLNLGQCQTVHEEALVNSTNRTEILLDGLRAHSTYNVTVTPTNDAGNGKARHSAGTTLQTEPKVAPELWAELWTRDSITFVWNEIPCGQRGGTITGYKYELKKKKDESWEQITNKTDFQKNKQTFSDLSPCTKYKLKVRAYTSAGPGPSRDTTQDTATIEEMSDLALDVSANELQASWTTEGNKVEPCPATNYRVRLHLLNEGQCGELVDPSVVEAGTTTHTNMSFLSLLAHSTYRVYVETEHGDATWIAPSTISAVMKTKEAPPLTAPDMSVSITNTSAIVDWYPIPCNKAGGNITGYQYELRNASGSMILKKHVTAATERASFTGHLGALYRFKVRALTNGGKGPWRTVDIQFPKEEAIRGGVSTSFVIVISASLPILMAIVIGLPIAIFIWKRRHKAEIEDGLDVAQGSCAVGGQIEVELQNLSSAPGAKQSPVSPTSAAAAAAADNRYTGSPRASLAKGLSQAAKMGHTPDPSVYESPKVGASKRRPKTPAKKTPEAAVDTGPVDMTQLALYIKRKSGKTNGFKQDYKSLSREPLHSWTVGKRDCNRSKNRYSNILPYNHSRVVLDCINGDPETDYINASYINGYKQKSRYIACQGPTAATIGDMWRMVWQERVGKIVMLTNLVENAKTKCHQYWPDTEEGSRFGEILVQKMDETACPNFVTRTFHLSMGSRPERKHRVVTQYHYTTWPDMKPPESSPLLQFLRRVQAGESTLPGPIAVHCSTGVGRTGSYIALDAMLEQADAEGHVDVLGFVRDMREQRYLMVQTLDQYKFIFDALLESSLSENTAIPVERFRQDLAKLKKQSGRTGTSGIEDQFTILESFKTLMSDDQCFGGQNSANTEKKRSKDCIPKDSTRPYLMTDRGEGSINYTNATFLDGYHTRRAYLATQAPLTNTLGDIWRMVFDNKSTCIVMLNQLHNDPNVVRYWPNEDSVCFGPLIVKFISEDLRTNDLVVRQFAIKYPLRKSEEFQTVCHIQYLGWPSGKDAPKSPSSLLKVLDAVRMWTNDHPNGPITVHCIDGLGASGTFCALMTLIDQLKEENIVDVFQVLKNLRATRSGIIGSLAQYQFCYQAIKCYLDSSSVYENM